VLPFAGGMAYLATIWVLLSHMDKLVLSNILSLSEFGYFTLVTVIATGISQVGAPISQAILPRMTYLLSQGNERDMVSLYRQSTQVVAALILPLTAVVAFFSAELLYAWTGDSAAAEWAAPVLFWFALGNCLVALGAFQFYMQFAHGQLRMHVIFNSLLACLQIPLVVYAAYHYGVITMAVLWFALRLLSFFIWTPIVHRRFARGLHWKWLCLDIGPSLVMTSLVTTGLLFAGMPLDQLSRLAIFAALIGVGMLMLLMNALVSSAPRGLLLKAFGWR
jgi:O-antigen/teichoic acid export membrane protein